MYICIFFCSEDLAKHKSTKSIAKMNQEKMSSLLQNKKSREVVDQMIEKAV